MREKLLRINYQLINYMKKLISVIGSDDSDENLSKYALEIAEEIGRQIAQKNGILICGGRGGIMKAACKGAKEKNGSGLSCSTTCSVHLPRDC